MQSNINKVSFFFFSSMLIYSFAGADQTFKSPKIGYGSSTAVVTAKTQENFFMGYQLGLEKVLGEKRAKALSLLKQVADGSPLGPIKSAEYLLNSGAVALVGFPSSNDSLLVADIAKNERILALFLGSGHPDLAKKGGTVFTTGVSINSSVETMLTYVSEHFSGKKGLAIINSSAVFSTGHEIEIKNIIASKKLRNVDISFAYLTPDLQISADDIEKLKIRAYGYMFVTPYPEELTVFFSQLEENSIDLPILASSSWSTAEPEILRRFLVNFKSPFYMWAEWIKNQPESHEFEVLVRKKYGREPISEIAFGYDLGVIIGTVVLRVHGSLTKETVLRAFKKEPCFKGLTIGRMCFPPSGGHGERKKILLKFSKTGFYPVSKKDE